MTPLTTALCFIGALTLAHLCMKFILWLDR